ncbi:MAG TPA: ATP-binding protein [Solirubrobacteraceae bacterium]|jgi:signal transduction histidine kinase|nr:ATP-binding protein [Solirubrobacteraceae bacterium]
MLPESELWLIRFTAVRGQRLLDAGTLLIVIEQESELRVVASEGERRPRLNIVPAQGSALGELYHSERSLSFDGPRGEDAAWLHELGLEARSALIEPLAIEGERAGMIVALRSDGAFNDKNRSDMSAFAADLRRRIEEVRTTELRRLRYGNEARERERTRWAREIHDESIQGIGALRLALAHARDEGDPEKLANAVNVALEGLGNEIDGLRHLITELRPAALDDLGLAAALQALARRAQAIDGLDVDIEIDLPGAAGEPGAEERRLDPELEGTIYRIVQEALTNVSRHAEASRAVVQVSERDGVLEASVTDDGRGLPGAERLGPRGDGLEGGFGMGGMRERAELVGGQLELGPAPERGTRVRLLVPLARRAAALADSRPVAPVTQ